MSEPNQLSHVNKKGEAHMVDVSGKSESVRIATASGKVNMSLEALKAISEGTNPKGDVLATARIAGIMGAKRTSELIPLCHPIPIQKLEIDLEVVSDGILIKAMAKTTDRTGIEMESLTAVSITGLTLIDMVKAVDPYATLVNVPVDTKSGGKSGDWKR